MSVKLLSNFNSGAPGSIVFDDEIAGVSWQCVRRSWVIPGVNFYDNNNNYSSIQSGGFGGQYLFTKYEKTPAGIYSAGFGAASGFSLPSNSSFTLEGFIYVQADLGFPDQVYIGLGSGSLLEPTYNAVIALSFNNNTVTLGLQLQNSGNVQATVAVGDIVPGNFYHVALVRRLSPGFEFHLYFNGTLVAGIGDANSLAFDATLLHCFTDVDTTGENLVLFNNSSGFDSVRLTDTILYTGGSITIPTPPLVAFSEPNVIAPEFDWEAKSAGPLVKIIRAQKFLRGWEVRSLPIILNVGSPEIGYEVASVANTQSQAIQPASSEYGREFDSPGLTDPTFVRGWEAGSLALIQLHNLTTVSLETDWEHDVAHPPHPSDYGWELTSPTYQVIHNVGVETPEMGWEVSTPDTREFAPGITPTNRIFIAGRGSSDRLMVATG